MLSFEEYRRLRGLHFPAIDRLMRDCVRQACGDNQVLREMLEYHLETGGKRLRAMAPVLVFLSRGLDPAEIYSFSACCELLHNATLVHDDLQDGDRQRRGRDTVWTRWGAAQAINAGDALFLVAQLAMERLTQDEERVGRVRRLFNRGTLDVIGGQTLEFEMKGLDRPTLESYFRMVEGKTSALFSLPLHGAAILAGATDDECSALAEASRHLGVLFQVQDDVLDLYGDKGRGEVGNDIREGKMSAMAVHALNNASPGEAFRVLEILRADRDQTGPDDVLFAIDLFATLGSLDFALDETARRTRAASEAVSAHPAFQALVEPLCQVLLAPIAPVLDRYGRLEAGKDAGAPR